jgi:hypothetical protein
MANGKCEFKFISNYSYLPGIMLAPKYRENTSFEMGRVELAFFMTAIGSTKGME